jgi:hypothetical protein
MLDLQTISAIFSIILQVKLKTRLQAISAIHSILGTNGRYFKSLLRINTYSFGIFTYTNVSFPLFTKFHKYASRQIELSFAFANTIMT